MNHSEIEKWSHSLDELEDDLLDHQILDIPVIAVGESWTDPEGRVWKQVMISYGKTGGRWCYWRFQDDHSLGVVVDSIFNGWSPRFAGMVRVPYDGRVTEALMLELPNGA